MAYAERALFVGLLMIPIWNRFEYFNDRIFISSGVDFSSEEKMKNERIIENYVIVEIESITRPWNLK